MAFRHIIVIEVIIAKYAGAQREQLFVSGKIAVARHHDWVSPRQTLDWRGQLKRFHFIGYRLRTGTDWLGVTSSTEFLVETTYGASQPEWKPC